MGKTNTQKKPPEKEVFSLAINGQGSLCLQKSASGHRQVTPLGATLKSRLF